MMRYWPRGVAKDRIDIWEKHLGTPGELIKKWKSGSIKWPDFSREYVKAMKDQKDKIAALAGLAKKQTITLLCSCDEADRCHRTILKQLIEQT